MLSWGVTPCTLAGRYRRFGETLVYTWLVGWLVSTEESTRRHNPEQQCRHLDSPENLKCNTVIRFTHLTS